MKTTKQVELIAQSLQNLTDEGLVRYIKAQRTVLEQSWQHIMNKRKAAIYLKAGLVAIHRRSIG